MAIFHLSVKPVQRSKGRSAVSAGAYRSGEKLKDERQNKTFNYSEKKDIIHTEIIGWNGSRSELWNAAEMAENRKDSTTAREYEVALPLELSAENRQELALDFGKWLNEKYDCAVDVCLHAGHDSDQPHAHILTTTRAVDGDHLADKKLSREWSDSKRKKEGLVTRKVDLADVRKQWEAMVNTSLENNHISERVDHRSYKDRGLDLIPQPKMGPAASAIEKKGTRTRLGDGARDAKSHNAEIIDLAKRRDEKIIAAPAMSLSEKSDAIIKAIELRKRQTLQINDRKQEMMQRLSILKKTDYVNAEIPDYLADDRNVAIDRTTEARKILHESGNPIDRYFNKKQLAREEVKLNSISAEIKRDYGSEIRKSVTQAKKEIRYLQKGIEKRTDAVHKLDNNVEKLKAKLSTNEREKALQRRQEPALGSRISKHDRQNENGFGR